MGFTADGLVHLISLVNRPRHEDVVRLAKYANLLPKFVRPLAAAAVAFLLLAAAGRSGQAVPMTLGVGLAAAIVGLLDDQVMDAAERNRSTVAMVFGGLGLFIGIAIAFVSQKELWVVVAAGVGGFSVAWLVGLVGLAVATLLVTLMNNLLKVLASPIAVPILAFAASRHRRELRVEHKEWVTSKGRPIVQFNRNGVSCVSHDNEAIFLSSSRLRSAAGIAAAGVPLFTQAEVFNPAVVNQRMGEAADDLAASGLPAGADFNVETLFNPATGLPMVGGIAGIDIMNNHYGFDDHPQ